MRFGLLLMSLVGRLSYPSILRLGGWFGLLILKLAPHRRHIAETNIKLCYPNYDEAKRQEVLRKNFISTGQGLLETAFVWHSDGEKLKAITVLHGEEHLLAAKNEGKGVILLCFHLTSLELGGTALANFHPMAAMYRQNRNPHFERAMTQGRERHVSRMIERENVRAMLKALRAGETVWYGADQDYGAKHSIFSKFFDIPAATITATSRFSQMTGARVVPMTHYRDLKTKRFHIRIHPEIEHFAELTEQQGADTINQFLETYLKGHPADYMWLHRRFKTRPEGEPPLYQPKSILKMRRMLDPHFERLIQSAQIVEGSSDRPLLLVQNNGYKMRFFYPKISWGPSIAKSFTKQHQQQLEIKQLFYYPRLKAEIVQYSDKNPD